MVNDVSARLLSQFADCLAERLGESGATSPLDETEPIDLVRVTAGTAAFRRYAGYALLALGAVVAWLAVRRLRRPG
jgi:hypothetical protein